MSEQAKPDRASADRPAERAVTHEACEVQLTLAELAAAGGIQPAWVVERVRAGFISIDGSEPAHWRFTDLHLTRVRRMVSMERDMEANPELAALVADLIEEVHQLRSRLTDRH